MRDFEYDSFGPWVYEIDDKHTIPPVFQKHYQIAESPIMLFKIPIKEERRNLRPGMNMYSSVVGLYETYIYTMDLNNGQVSELRIPYSDIKAAANSVHLLEGIFTIYTGTGLYEINYNASSEKIINKAVAIVRDKLMETTKPAKAPMPHSDNGNFGDNITTLFKSIITEMKETEEVITPVLFQRRVRVERLNNNILYKALELYLRSELLSSMFLSLESELVLISRGFSFNYRKMPVYKKVIYYIPFNSISSIDITESDIYKNILKVSICISGNKIDTFIEKENKDLNTLMKFFHLE